jgi:hypothetical protein
MNNFTASFLTHMNKKILDELGNPISTITYETKMYPLKYNPPTIVFDFLEPEGVKQSVIKEIGLKALDKLGFCLCSRAPPKEWGWSKLMKQLYLLRIGSIEEKYAYKIKSTTNMKKSIILFDEANLKIKLVSPRANPQGEGPWIDVK